MTPSLSCPSCNRFLGRILHDGTLKVACPGCRTEYHAVYGRLSQWQTEVQPLFYLGAGLPSRFRRRYEFRITTPGRSLKLLKFSVPGQADSVPVRPGDRLSILYSPRGDRMDKLVAIYNHTVGRVYRPPFPIPTGNHLLQTRGTVSGVIAAGAILGGVPLGAVSVGALGLLFYTRMVDSAELSTPDLRLENPAEARLMGEIQLVRQKQNLQQRIDELRQDGEKGRSLFKRLQQFRSKLLAVSLTVYATRVANLETAIRLLQQRLDHEQRLIDEYTQTLQMIEIELEAATFSEQLPMDDLTHQIFQRIDELKALETENQEFQLQLEANEEVRRLSLYP